jgi:hypothetical protein
MFIHHFINYARLCMSRLNASIQLNALREARPQASVSGTDEESHSCDTVSWFVEHSESGLNLGGGQAYGRSKD